ncbi:MAG: uracil-DNA glycosylase family protein [Henriciella sp.]|nr:uracil-DNA glycosylase family protein [Henriciella sp.]
MTEDLNKLTTEIRACRLCADDMDRPPNPVLQVSGEAKILIAGQAPGNLADVSGRPFTDPSGVRLRAWLGVSEDEFYDARRIALVPMGFCFPGYDDKGGDLPPFKRCARTWRSRLMQSLPNIQLIVLIGGYAQKWHLGSRAEKTLTATVARWTDYVTDGIFVTPHPSWRNTGWLKRNPWFETDVLPDLRKRVRSLL